MQVHVALLAAASATALTVCKEVHHDEHAAGVFDLRVELAQGAALHHAAALRSAACARKHVAQTMCGMTYTRQVPCEVIHSTSKSMRRKQALYGHGPEEALTWGSLHLT
jgi:hypothetical protein